MRTSIFVVLALSLISQASFHQLDDGTTGLQPAHEARHHPHPPGADVLAKPQKRSSNPERRSGKSKASQKRHSKAVKKRKVVELERRRAEEIERRREAEELERRLAIFDKLFGGGVLKAKSSCGASNSSKTVTNDNGPNGHINFLNCGIDTDKGWDPPKVKASQLKTADFDKVMKDDNSIFKPCRAFKDMFKKHADDNKTISIAMQESTCNPNVEGGGGEQGMMQITKDKCGDAPGGNCKDADFNIRKGLEYLAGVLKETNDNIFEAMGKYNGWYRGLTKAKATAAKNSNCCRCQNNLDYLQQTFNGWLQGQDGGKLGTNHNLADCH